MPTQAEVAADLGIRERGVRELRDIGAIPDPRTATLEEIRSAYMEHLREVAAGRQERDRPKSNGSSTPEERAETLRGFLIPRDLLAPWIQPDGTGYVLPVDEFCTQYGIGDELIPMLQWAFPLVPPLPGEKRGRVSVMHAGWWNLTTRALIREAGGDWRADDLAAELDKLSGAVRGTSEPTPPRRRRRK